MNLKGKDLRGPALDSLAGPKKHLVGPDFRKADLRGADLRFVDLRGADLRGADLRNACNITITELVDFRKGEWIALAAWDAKTQFPEAFEEKLWTLGLREGANGKSLDVRRRGLAAAARMPMDKSRGDLQDVVPYSACDG